MSYCINPACPHPENSNEASQCSACGLGLVLRKRYRIVKPLGKGGFGATFLAHDLSLPGSPKCVVKQLRPSTRAPKVLDMAQKLFKREAKTLGKIGDHPQIPRLLDYFSGKQQFYLVQEYVEGCNLREDIRASGPYNEEKIRTFLREILPILDYIHTQEVIHRDIKPANILRRTQDNRLVLIDFGAVKDEVQQMTMFGTGETAFTNFAIGTAGFAPPEQMALRPVYSSDIYAVAMTCVYLMTGKSPNALEHDPVTGEVQWRSLVSVSDSLAAILRKMLEMSVYQRYHSAEEVLSALDQELDIPDFSDGLTVQPSNAFREATTVFEGSDLTVDPPTDHATPQPDKTPALRPFAAQAEQIRARKARLQQREVTPNNLASVSGGLSSSQGAPTVTTYYTSAKSQGNNAPEIWDEISLCNAYAKGERYFTDSDFNGLNLRNQTLSGAYFSESRFSQTNFQNANLSRTDFCRARLTYATLRDANLTHARFTFANLEGADLRGANLTHANLSHANLRGTNLCGANLRNALISEQQLTVAKTNWRTIKPKYKRRF